MALILVEEGAEAVREIIYGRERVYLPFLVIMEVEYKLLQVKAEIVDMTLARIESWPVEVHESYYSWRREAARIKAEFYLSLADSWVAAFALGSQAALVHKDPEFDAVPGLLHERLPYKRSAH